MCLVFLVPLKARERELAESELDENRRVTGMLHLPRDKNEVKYRGRERKTHATAFGPQGRVELESKRDGDSGGGGSTSSTGSSKLSSMDNVNSRK